MKSFPFDSKILQGKDGDTQYDRAIDSKTLREYFHLLYSNGVFAGNDNDCFEVVLDETSIKSNQTGTEPFRVIVKAGTCNIEGALGIEEKETAITIDPIGKLEERTDSIVLRLDTNIDARKISIEYKKGNPIAGTPNGDYSTFPDIRFEPRPELTRNSTVYELRLANIFVEPLFIRESYRCGDLIEDTRWNTDDCGVVLCNPRQIDTNGIADKLKEIYKNTLKHYENELSDYKAGVQRQVLEIADDLEDILKKDEGGKFALKLDEYVNNLRSEEYDKDKILQQIDALQTSSETLQKTTLPAINSNIDNLKKTVNEDIQNTLHSNGTSINSLGDKIGTLVSRVSTLEDKIREGFFFNKELKILELAVSTGTAYAETGLTIVIKKNGYTRTVKLTEALEDQWRKSYNHCWILKDRSLEINSSEVNAGRSLDGTCSIILENKYFRTWEGIEDNNPDFYLGKRKTKGILFATFDPYSLPSMPTERKPYAIKFYVDGSIYYADYNKKEDRYMWAIPINSSNERINLNFIFDFEKAYEAEDTDYLSVGIKFNFSLKYIHA